MGLRNLPSRLRTADLSCARVPAKTADPLYATPEYKLWREAVIARADGRCQARGCGRRERRMFADHVVEVKDGGARFDPANGQCLCGSHHTAKTAAERAKRMGAGR